MKLQTIIVSTRPGRIGPPIAEWFHEIAKSDGRFDAELIDLKSFDLPVFDEPKHPRFGEYVHEHTKRWSKSVASADAFVFVTPEYNYFAPAPLVNAVTYLSKEWFGKPAGLLSYGGVSGGLRAAQSAKSLLTSVGIMPIQQGVGVPMAMKHIKDGVFEPEQIVADGAKPMLDALDAWGKALANLRA